MSGSDDEFAAVMRRAADIFERTWQPAPYPDPREHPAAIAREASSHVTQLVTMDLKGQLHTSLTSYQAGTLTEAMEILDQLRDQWGPVGDTA
jgi:hypothetical protein